MAKYKSENNKVISSRKKFTNKTIENLDLNNQNETIIEKDNVEGGNIVEQDTYREKQAPPLQEDTHIANKTRFDDNIMILFILVLLMKNTHRD